MSSLTDRKGASVVCTIHTVPPRIQSLETVVRRATRKSNTGDSPQMRNTLCCPERPELLANQQCYHTRHCGKAQWRVWLTRSDTALFACFVNRNPNDGCVYFLKYLLPVNCLPQCLSSVKAMHPWIRWLSSTINRVAVQ